MAHSQEKEETTTYDSELRDIVYRNWKVGDEIGLFDEVQKFIAKERIQVKKEFVDELQGKIEALGHQQDDDTIWCNMDEVLALLPEQESTNR